MPDEMKIDQWIAEGQDALNRRLAKRSINQGSRIGANKRDIDAIKAQLGVVTPPQPPPPDDDGDPGDEQPPVVEPPVTPAPPPAGDYWTLTAKARSNGLGINLGVLDPWDTTWPWSNMLCQAQFRDPNYGYTDPPDIASKELLLLVGHDCFGKMPPPPWSFDADGGSQLKNSLPTAVSNNGIALRLGPGSFGANPSLVSAWASEDGFHKMFLDRLAPVAGYVRWMDAQRTNNSQKKNWLEENASSIWYTEYGVPLKRMLDLCNKIGAFPWLCIPPLATDSYVQSFCQFVKANLNPALRCIVEHGNENWNFMFQQAQHFGSASNYTARARQIMSIVKSILPDSIRVIGSQEDNTGITDQVLSGDCSMFTHLTTGWYMGYWQDGSNSTPDDPVQIINNCINDIPARVANLNQHKEKAQAKGLKLCGYEGGQHLVGVNGKEQQYAARFQAAVRHPMMASAEKQLRAATKDIFDFQLHYHFCGRDSQWGYWGLLDFIGADLSNAYRYNTFVADAQA